MTVHHHDTRTTVVHGDDREGPAAAFIALVSVLLVAFLVWFFAFSGIVFHRGVPATDTGPRVTNNNVNNSPTNEPSPMTS